MKTFILTIKNGGKLDRITTHAYREQDATNDVLSFYDLTEDCLIAIEGH